MDTDTNSQDSVSKITIQVLQQQLSESQAEIETLKKQLAEAQQSGASPEHSPVPPDNKAGEVDEVKTAFISAASHQLRTPLATIKWMLSLFQADPELNKMPAQMQMINQAYESIERIIGVVNDLLNVTRIQNGHIPYNPQQADPKPLLMEVIEAMKPVAESRKIKLEVSIDPSVPPCLFDPVLLKECFQNITNNALDYNHEDGFVHIEAKVMGTDLEIVVTNSGMGINPEDQGKIFEPLYRSPEAGGLNPNGSGLGLYLSKAVINEHKGTLSFVSEPGKETAFTITIPIVQA